MNKTIIELRKESKKLEKEILRKNKEIDKLIKKKKEIVMFLSKAQGKINKILLAK